MPSPNHADIKNDDKLDPRQYYRRLSQCFAQRYVCMASASLNQWSSCMQNFSLQLKSYDLILQPSGGLTHSKLPRQIQ